MDIFEFLDGVFPIVAIVIVIVVALIIVAVNKISKALKNTQHDNADDVQINNKFFGKSNIDDRLKEYREKKAAQSATTDKVDDDIIEVEGEPMISVLDLDEDDYKSTARAIVWGEILATPKCKSIGRRK